MNLRPIVVAAVAGLAASYWLAPREVGLVACVTLLALWTVGWGASALKRRLDTRRRLDAALDGVRGFDGPSRPPKEGP